MSQVEILPRPSSPGPALRLTTPIAASPGRAMAESTPNGNAPGPATHLATPTGSSPGRATRDATPRSQPPGPAEVSTTPRQHSPGRVFAELRLLAESFEDAQKARISIENRIRSGQDEGPVAEALESLRHAESKLSLAMRRSFRRAAPGVARWARSTVGIAASGSDHLIARLIGTIGHPVIAQPYHWEGEGSERHLVADEPFVRNIAKLWAYCGHGDPSRRRRKGMGVDEAMGLGNPRAKMLVHLLAEAAVKCVGSPATDGAMPESRPPAADHLNGDGSKAYTRPRERSTRRRSPYRDTYDLARIRYADREDWTDGHKHAAALRLVGKEILRDIWLAAL